MGISVKIKRGDTVRVISGRDKGVEGEVIRVLPRESKVVIQGVNIRKKHCPKCGETTRVGIRREDDDVTRYCKRCDAEIGS